MKYMLTLVAATAIGLGVSGCKDEDGRTAGQKAGDATEKAVDKTVNAADKAKDAVVGALAPSGASDISGMRGAMEGVVQNAMDQNNFKTMTNHFVDADRKRLEATPLKTAGLDNNVEAFKKAWRDKYKSDVFTVMDSDKIFSDDFVTLMSSQSEDANKRGTATIKASHGLPQLEIPMVAQDGKWRLDVPDDRSAQQIRDDLLKATQELHAKAESWPADVHEAYRVVAHRVLLAVMGKDAGAGE